MGGVEMVAGKVVRFDGIRGYGFIAPEHGGEDVFLHANDLLIPESAVHSGALVEFEIEEGERGPKASSVRLSERSRPQVPPSIQASTVRTEDGEERSCDVLSVAEYTYEVTELLLGTAPWLTGEQIKQLRQQLVQLGSSHGWAQS
ncbi:cold shock domain-containing protein [Streptomyces marokkonensis]|uniref:Cold shock domain-containing protein n=2 Tax=Streptomyces marokkonensis TaxID=324855 RepID=A0ABP7S5K0_9ACTN